MSDMTHYHGDTCDPPHPDPLAEALDKELTGTRFNEEDGSTSVYFNDGAHLARVAREFIAAEIEAEQPTTGAKAYRIARGES